MDPIMLEEIKNLVTIYGGGIKSVQRGTVKAQLKMTTPVTIPIAKVNPELCDLHVFIYGNPEANYLTYALDESGESIIVSTTNPMGAWDIGISWQVVEHY